MERDQLQKLESVISYMQKHYARPIKMEEISQYAGITPKVLNRILSEKYGCTFSVLLRKYRLYQVARLIHFNYIPIGIMAKRSGIKQQYFTKEFKREFGVTPKEFKHKKLFPDMPIFSNINGYPLSLEYKVTDDVVIEGYPIKTPENGTIDLMWDASYGFRHPNPNVDLSGKEKLWGVWWGDEKDNYRLCYLMGKKVDEDSEPKEGLVRQNIPGGKYAVFSVSRGNNYFDTANNAVEMAWHAFKSWQVLSFKETNKWAFTYETFDEENVYLHIPLEYGFGGVEPEKEFGSKTIDKIIHFIDENILEDLDWDEVIYGFSMHDQFYREQFRSCYKVSLPDYIHRKKMYVLAQHLSNGKLQEEDIVERFHFKSFEAFESEFRKIFGVSIDKYQMININLIDLDKYYEENMSNIVSEIVNIPDMTIAGKVIKSRADRKSIDRDLPQMTAFWMENDFECLQDSLYENAERKAAIYRSVPSAEEIIFDYVLGPVIEEDRDYPEVLEEITIQGGKYMVFSCNYNQIQNNDLVNDIRMMVRCIDHVWMYQNWLRTDFTSRVCFYLYEEKKVYYYVPVYG